MAVTSSEMLAYLNSKATRQRQMHLSRWEQARLDAQAIIAHIASRFQPLRIWQWGSILDPGKFCDFSDIDIALEGIADPRDFFSILRDAERLTLFPLDILQLDTLEPHFAEIIRRKGRVVYER